MSTFIKPNSTPLHLSILAPIQPLSHAAAKTALEHAATAPLPTLIANQLLALQDSLQWDIAAKVYTAKVLAPERPVQQQQPKKEKKSESVTPKAEDKLHKTNGSASDIKKKDKKDKKKDKKQKE
ncbi:hypothetical protein HDU79_004103 [Rhizoclosmatium sp. JEL0117]|nr:hypothetical protein HDU79_004103 [Rhizoclosmatium sp. JEL0117]